MSAAKPAPHGERILCIAPRWLGDAIFSLPAVDALRRRFPGADIDVLARIEFAGLLSASGRFRAVHALRAGAGRLRRLGFHAALRREAYTLAVVFPDSFSAGLGAWLTGAPRRVGRVGDGRGPLLTLRLPRRPPRGARHVVDEYLALAESCGGVAEGPQRIPALDFPEAGRLESERLFQERWPQARRRIALCPTAAYGPAKRWPLEHWGALADDLKARGFDPAFFCAPHESASVAFLAQGRSLPLLSPSLVGLAACFAACEAVVANDSGSLHLAAALGVPSLGIYGSTDVRWTGPRGPRTRALSLNLECSPCFARDCPLGHLNCLHRLTPDRVTEALLQELSR